MDLSSLGPLVTRAIDYLRNLASKPDRSSDYDATMAEIAEKTLRKDPDKLSQALENPAGATSETLLAAKAVADNSSTQQKIQDNLEKIGKGIAPKLAEEANDEARAKKMIDDYRSTQLLPNEKRLSQAHSLSDTSPSISITTSGTSSDSSSEKPT